MIWKGEKFAYSFTDNATVKVSNVINEIKPLKSNSIFIPAKEVLSMFNRVGISITYNSNFSVFGYYGMPENFVINESVRLHEEEISEVLG